MIIRQKVGDYLLDVSKLVFGGSVLSTVLGMEFVSKGDILIVSVLAVLILFSCGLLLIKEK